MKKRCLMVVCLFLMLLNVLSACSSRYKRISYNKDTLGDSFAQNISSDTKVEFSGKEIFPEEIPIYEINERIITDQELRQMKQNLNIPDSAPGQSIKLDGNKLVGDLADYSYTDRSFYDMTDEEVEIAAWEVFEKLPFMEGTYEYLGVKVTHTRSDSVGEHTLRAGVSFRRLLDGTRIVGNDKCYLYFDGSGFVEFFIELYSYEKIGMMDIISLDDASQRIKNPDALSFSGGRLGVADTMQVEKVKLLFENQYSRGCTILQPVYNFIGTATDAEGATAEFNSLVIAIPEKYTYEEKE